MATNIEDISSSSNPSSPRVKFRWCAAVPCKAKEVYLELSSLSQTRLSLEWAKDLGWYESGLVSLPFGLHSGIILIREKVPLSPLSSHPNASLQSHERSYKVEPFFITPHKFSIELFLKGNKNGGVVQNKPLNKDRHGFEDQCEHPREGTLSPPRKWLSIQELREFPNGDTDETTKYSSLKRSVGSENLLEVHGFNLGPSYGSENCLFEDGKKASFLDETCLRKWSSAEGKSNLSLNRNCSNRLESSRNRSPEEEKYSIKSHNHSLITKANEKETEISNSLSCSLCTKPNKSDSLLANILFDEEIFDKLRQESLARTEGIESLLNETDDNLANNSKTTKDNFKKYLHFPNTPSPRNETKGYGCLITFESRSTSMDDLVSTKALEDVLVSLTSTDTEPKLTSLNLHQVENSQKDNEIETLEICERQIAKFEEVCLQSEAEIFDPENFEETADHYQDSGEEEIRCPESDNTINEDENFKYDSLKNDDQKFPINIKDVLDSEDSLEYPANIETSLQNSVSVIKNPIAKSDDNLGFYNLEIKNLKQPESISDSVGEESEGRKDSSNSYNLEGDKSVPRIVNASFTLVHPGSLRSESENGNGSSATLVDSQSSSDTLMGSQKSLKQRKIIDKEILNSKRRSTVHTIRGSVVSSYLVDRKQERNSAFKKSQKNLDSKTQIIFREKPAPIMNTTGTQTTYRSSHSPKYNRYAESRGFNTSLASKFKENQPYTTLPNKVNGPWTSKIVSDKVNNTYPYSNHSNIRSLQNSLYNLDRADQILRTIHPFDYRPTLVHRCSSSESSSNSSLSKRLTKSTKTSVHRTNRSAVIPSTPVSDPSYSAHQILPSYSAPVQRYQMQRTFKTPTRLKKVPKPFFSIYNNNSSYARGDKVLNYNDRFYNDTLPYKSSSSYQGTDLHFRPATSLPDLRVTQDESFYPYTQPLRGDPASKAHSSPFYAPEEKNKYSNAVDIYHQNVRRKSLDSKYLLSRSNSGSTDSLIEEAYNAAYNNVNNMESKYRSRSLNKDAPLPSPSRDVTRFRRRRTKSSSGLAPAPPLIPAAPRPQSSVSGILRTRSETDLRMIGDLTGGHQGEPPYLPYRKEQLTLGQVVKVLVPGEGVAMARIVYTPMMDSPFLAKNHSRNEDITVVLISEPTQYSGSVINIPLHKILLAWPKV